MPTERLLTTRKQTPMEDVPWTRSIFEADDFLKMAKELEAEEPIRHEAA